MSTDWDAFLNNSIDGSVMLNNFLMYLLKFVINIPLYIRTTNINFLFISKYY